MPLPKLPLLCECANHQRSPYSICCGGLMNDPAQLWLPVPVRDQREVSYDFLCFDCFTILAEEVASLEQLASVVRREARAGQLQIICSECLRATQASVFIGPLLVAAAARWVLRHFGKDEDAAAIDVVAAATADDEQFDNYFGEAREEADDDVT